MTTRPKALPAVLMLAILSFPFVAMPLVVNVNYSLPALPTAPEAPQLPDIGPSYDDEGEDYCNGTIDLDRGGDVTCRPWMGKPMIAPTR